MGVMAEVLQQAEHDWEQLMAARNAATEEMSRSKVDELGKYEEKIGMKEMFSKHGVPQPQVFLATRPPWSPVQMEAGIRAGILAAGIVVVKPSHLTTGKAVFLVDAHLTGRSVLPVGPGRKVMEEAAGKGGMRKFSLSDMERQLEEAMRENAGAREVKPLRECSRGVLEMVDHDGELRVL